jgi:hypothetical protein
MPPGTVLEYESTPGDEAFSRYVLYVNVKAGELPDPQPSEHRWFRAPVWAWPLER